MYLYVELRGNQFHAMPEEYPLVIHEIAVFFSQGGKVPFRQKTVFIFASYPILLGYFFFIRKFFLLYYYYCPRLRIEGGVE